MAALKEEEDQKRAQLDVLDKDMRAKSITIQEYEKKKAELENKERRIKVIHSEIDRLNREIPSKLKIGMRREDVAGVMEIGKPRPTDAGTCHMAGRYFLIFEGDVLRSVVAKGSVAQVSTAGTRRFFKGTFTIENCEDAALYGKNVAAL
jgi:hypothetical protein